jgi:hypothetical protein
LVVVIESKKGEKQWSELRGGFFFNKKFQTKKAAQEAGKKQVVQTEPTVTKISIAKSENANKPPPLPPKPKLPPRKEGGNRSSAKAESGKTESESASAEPVKVEAEPEVVVAAAPLPAPVVAPPRPSRVVCTVCKELIRIGDPVVDGANCHAKCWCCSICAQPLRTFFLVEGRLPVCESCNEATKMSCSVCNKPLKEYYRVGKQIFCEDHYAPLRCTICKKGLTQYYSHEGQTLCVMIVVFFFFFFFLLLLLFLLLVGGGLQKVD